MRRRQGNVCCWLLASVTACPLVGSFHLLAQRTGRLKAEAPERPGEPELRVLAGPRGFHHGTRLPQSGRQKVPRNARHPFRGFVYVGTKRSCAKPRTNLGIWITLQEDSNAAAMGEVRVAQRRYAPKVKSGCTTCKSVVPQLS